MNKTRRKQLDAITKDLRAMHDEFSVIKARAEWAKVTLETLRDEEQEYYDNMPEGIQGGDRGERSTSAIEAIEAAIEKLEEVADSDTFDVFNEAADSVDEATQ